MGQFSVHFGPYVDGSNATQRFCDARDTAIETGMRRNFGAGVLSVLSRLRAFADL